jgi:type II secretory pathway pseudopilin PulG
MHSRLHRWLRSRALTLIEIVIAMAIASFALLSFMASTVYFLRQNAENRLHLSALQIASMQKRLFSAASFTLLGEPSPGATAFEKQFDYYEDTPKTVPSDPYLAGVSGDYSVYFQFTGWGTVSNSTTNSLTVNIPANQDQWETDEWVGSYVEIMPNAGDRNPPSYVGQIMRITGNSGNRLTVTGNLTGGSTTGWQILPPSGCRFMINNGKTCRVFVEWGNKENHRSISRTYLIAQHNLLASEL